MIYAVKEKLGFLRGTPLWKPLKIAYNDRRSRGEFDRLRRLGGNAARLRILAINHYFDGELEAFAAAPGDPSEFSIASITPEPLFSRAVAWFPDALRTAAIPYDDPSVEPVRERYRDFCRRLFHELRAAFAFDCVLTPSDCFYWLREFLVVCRENGVVTIVADKEGMISPRSYESEPARIASLFPPLADFFFVWSERQSQFWQKAGVPPERLRLTGSARSDLFVNLRLKAAPDTVLVFDFDADAYINNIDWREVGWTGARNWSEFRCAFYRAIAQAALDFPAIRFLIKCHPQQVHTSFPPVGLLDLPNVSVIRGAPRGLPELVANARAVVGFQTTALVEASLAGAAVLYAAWGDLYAAVADRILPWHEADFGLEWVRSEEQLAMRLQELLRADRRPVPPDAGRLSTYFHRADGGVARRLLEAAAEVTAASRAGGRVAAD
jgi:hypothetical protein